MEDLKYPNSICESIARVVCNYFSTDKLIEAAIEAGIKWASHYDNQKDKFDIVYDVLAYSPYLHVDQFINVVNRLEFCGNNEKLRNELKNDLSKIDIRITSRTVYKSGGRVLS